VVPALSLRVPFFQRLAVKYRGRLTFLSVDSLGSRRDAEDFLHRVPTPYPHYFDPDANIARLFRGGVAWATSAYYDREGEVAYTHQGASATRAEFNEDIREYTISG
jgi:hypothetical protein